MLNTENSGQIIVVLNGSIRDKKKWPVYFRHPSIDSELMDGNFLRILSLSANTSDGVRKRFEHERAMAHRRQRLTGEAPPDDDWSEELKSKKRALEKKYGSDIVQFILEQRLEISILLNSEGGSCIESTNIENAIRYAKTHEGKASVYVSAQAASAATDIFNAVDHRHLLENSEIMYHLGQPAESAHFNPTALDLTHLLLIQGMRDFFKAQLSGEKLREVMDTIDNIVADPDNEDCEINFTGKEMADLGIAQAYGSLGALAATFCQNTQVDLNSLDKKDPRARFFKSRK